MGSFSHQNIGTGGILTDQSAKNEKGKLCHGAIPAILLCPKGIVSISNLSWLGCCHSLALLLVHSKTSPVHNKTLSEFTKGSCWANDIIVWLPMSWAWTPCAPVISFYPRVRSVILTLSVKQSRAQVCAWRGKDLSKSIQLVSGRARFQLWLDPSVGRVTPGPPCHPC